MLFSRKRTLCVSSLVRFFSNTAIPVASQEGYFVCILTCDIFILTCHTNCFLGLDVNSTCFIYCTPTSFPLFFIGHLFYSSSFFTQLVFLPTPFYPGLFILNCCFAGRGHFLYPHYVTFVLQCFHSYRTRVALTLIHWLSCHPLVKFILAHSLFPNFFCFLVTDWQGQYLSCWLQLTF